ncbi:hypothetical protein AMTR_s00007p00256930 [Amborella trichopoda]|uniref:Uncharacterized protein n=1 Tax=Amborella trichopoda TaxID=13333 RepID=W1PC19_AMBTC|nr:hypothetical protein AMTR_s00007p00256930 [Amborella trichopoda]
MAGMEASVEIGISMLTMGKDDRAEGEVGERGEERKGFTERKEEAQLKREEPYEGRKEDLKGGLEGTERSEGRWVRREELAVTC